MSQSWLIALLAAVVVALGFTAFGALRVNANKRVVAGRDRLDRLDTVADWPPEGTRLLGSAGRKAHAALVTALPECMIFAQVPLARFVRVPRRQSYAEWITRVGHMAVDFLICDKSSYALGVVIIQSINDTPRAQKRRERINRVLHRAGIKVFVWREEALPSASAARTMIVQTAALGAGEAGTPSSSFEDLIGGAQRKLPLPDVAAADPSDPWGSTDRPRDPPPSTWFDDIDSGPAPLSPTPAPAQKATS
jgi:Protein of unknown function (DUF2726)